MKISYLPLLRTLVLCLFASFSAYSQLVPSQADNAILRYIDPSNPIEANNVDPNWDWTPCCSGHTMYYNTGGSGVIQLSNVSVPFHSNGHTLADAITNDAKDMWQQDGWMLAFKDFGTPTQAPPYPFFALYNKYKGILRVMIYNSGTLLNTYYKMTLSFRDTSPRSALFTYTEKRNGKQSIANFDQNSRQVVISKASQGQGWFYADFILAGYDPNLNSNSVLRLTLDAVKESQLSASGSLSVDQVIRSSPGGHNPADDVSYAVNNGYKSYSNIATLASDANKSGGPFGSILGIFSYFSDLVGLFNYFISGKNISSGREPLSFKGSTTFNGTITTERQVLEYYFALSRSLPDNSSYYKPVQDIPWGVLNITNHLTLNQVNTNEYTHWCPESQSDVTDIQSVYYGNPIYYVINPNIGLTLVSAQVQAVGYDNTFYDLSTIGSVLFGYADSKICPSTFSQVVADFGIKFEFQINSPTKNYDNRLVFYKVYNVGSSGTRQSAVSENKELRMSPNPFRREITLSFPPSQTGTISIWDSKGLLVKNFIGHELASGSIIWDGKTSYGADSPAGLYLLQFSDFKQQTTTKRAIKLD